MKRMILVVVAVMSMTYSFAKEQYNKQHTVKNVENYDMTIDMRRLASTLELNSDQMDVVKKIHESFSSEMMSASTTRGMKRHMMVGQAIDKDVRHMRQVLNDQQFHTYMMLLGATLQNRDFR